MRLSGREFRIVMKKGRRAEGSAHAKRAVAGGEAGGEVLRALVLETAAAEIEQLERRVRLQRARQRPAAVACDQVAASGGQRVRCAHE